MFGLASETIFSVAKIGRFPDAIKKGEWRVIAATGALGVGRGSSGKQALILLL